MRFYCLHEIDVESSSHGYQWFTSRAAAEKARAGSNDPDECDIEAVDVVPTKAGILAALRQHASHPDNG